VCEYATGEAGNGRRSVSGVGNGINSRWVARPESSKGVEALQVCHALRRLRACHPAGFAALSAADWHEMEEANAAVVSENFIVPGKLPNLITELTVDKLPPNARARFERMLNRNKNS